ncbi:MAG: DUF899 domain-containing protein [Gammaproteobacteria bacterium]|nr:DUF899 domain-containing protein [Gammaproteobacteria bacterium]
MGKYHDNCFPGEDDAYRSARDELLKAEIDLRKQIEQVAALRRQLPPGGALKEDYVFDQGASDLMDSNAVKQTLFSELFEPGKNSLIIYSFMYAPDADMACPACTSILDSLNGGAMHINDKANIVVVAKSPIKKIRQYAVDRGWPNLRLLSSFNNTYNADYFTETPNGDQIPSINVFTKTPAGIAHFYNAELLHAPSEEGQHPRHADMVWPLWSFFDMTPEGRGTDWFPKLSYDTE